MTQRNSTGRRSDRPTASRAEALRCTVCGQAVVTITITVDGNPLEMSACANCDTRSWNLAGTRVELAKVLAQVGAHSGRRR